MNEIKPIENLIKSTVDLIKVSPGDGKILSGSGWAFLTCMLFTVVIYFQIAGSIDQYIQGSLLIEKTSWVAAYFLSALLILALFFTKQIWVGEYKAAAPGFIVLALGWVASVVAIFVTVYLSWGGSLAGLLLKEENVVRTQEIFVAEVVAICFSIAYLVPPVLAGINWHQIRASAKEIANKRGN